MGVPGDLSDLRRPANDDGAAEAPAPEEPLPPPSRSGPTINTVVALGLAVVGLRLGLVPLHDNSFFTHLATGRLILDRGAIPRTDPYSFTAFGDPWTVQSWGASVVYASVERVAGLLGIRILVAVCTAGLVLLTWRLTRPAHQLLGRLVLAVLAVGIGATFWVERPLLFGLLFLFVALFAAEGDLDPRWLVPAMWLWVNMHGSFPLGLAALGTLAVGRLLDREDARTEFRALGWAAVGTVLGAVNPLGYRLLVFPLELLERREAFSKIVEWQPPTWGSWAERFFALQLLLAVVLVVTRGRTWRAALPLVVFGLAAVTSLRNIPPASLVLLPGMALGLAGLGSIDGGRRVPILRPAVAAFGVLALVVAGVGVIQVDTDLVDYPVASAEWMRDQDLLDLDARVVSRDFVGNYLEVRYGPDQVRAYFDDRVDMYPLQVVRDYSSLLDEDGDYAGVLDRTRATAVLWDRDSDFGRWLERTSAWQVVHRDKDWLVAVPAD